MNEIDVVRLADPLEVVQTTIAVLGLLINIIGTLAATTDRRLLIKSNANGGLMIAASHRLVVELLLLVGQVVFVGLGVFSILMKPGIDLAQQDVHLIGRLVLTILFTAVSITMYLQQERLERYDLIRAATASLGSSAAPATATAIPVEHLQAIETNTANTAANTAKTEQTIDAVKDALKP